MVPSLYSRSIPRRKGLPTIPNLGRSTCSRLSKGVKGRKEVDFVSLDTIQRQHSPWPGIVNAGSLWIITNDDKRTANKTVLLSSKLHQDLPLNVNNHLLLTLQCFPLSTVNQSAKFDNPLRTMDWQPQSTIVNSKRLFLEGLRVEGRGVILGERENRSI